MHDDWRPHELADLQDYARTHDLKLLPVRLDAALALVGPRSRPTRPAAPCAPSAAAARWPRCRTLTLPTRRPCCPRRRPEPAAGCAGRLDLPRGHRLARPRPDLRLALD
ncbi:hypothetical protein [Deinococcus multiflagellatus]|uniref:Uncharacterized protein n=1 Tax=Deinococcus multiflagellatus TaxID=1656887 RepID=A0ABW1ZR15_9DEIO